MPEKQLCTAPIIGGDGNVYAVVGTCRDALRRCGYSTESQELVDRILHKHEADSYDKALVICMEYCEPVGAGEKPRKCDELDDPEEPDEEDLDEDDDDYDDLEDELDEEEDDLDEDDDVEDEPDDED